jgi:hypothetical protein
MFNNKRLEMVLLTIYVVECKSLILSFFVRLAMLLHCGFVVFGGWGAVASVVSRDLC